MFDYNCRLPYGITGIVSQRTGDAIVGFCTCWSALPEVGKDFASLTLIRRREALWDVRLLGNLRLGRRSRQGVAAFASNRSREHAMVWPCSICCLLREHSTLLLQSYTYVILVIIVPLLFVLATCNRAWWPKLKPVTAN